MEDNVEGQIGPVNSGLPCERIQKVKATIIMPIWLIRLEKANGEEILLQITITQQQMLWGQIHIGYQVGCGLELIVGVGVAWEISPGYCQRIEEKVTKE